LRGLKLLAAIMGKAEDSLSSQQAFRWTLPEHVLSLADVNPHHQGNMV
jgi:hypothetical protein